MSQSATLPPRHVAAPSPEPAARAVVIVSKGHVPTSGGGNTGAVGVGDLSEFALVGDVGDVVMEELARLGIPAVTAPRQRVPSRFRFVAEVMAKYPGRRVAFVDIHANAFGDPRARGTETYVSSQTSKSLALGSLVQAHLCESFRDIDPSWVDRGVRFNNYLVFSRTAALACGVKGSDFDARYFCTLVELGFITNEQDAAVLATRGGLAAAARSIAGGIREWLTLNT